MIEQSESIKELAAALSKAQAEIDTVNKGRLANLPSKDPSKKGYSYNYADLSDIMEAVSPVLAKHGLSVAQFPSMSVAGQSLATQVMHESGEWLRSEMEMPVGSGVTAQALGSAITYCRRYAFSAALGIVTDKDDDGKHATENRGGESQSTTHRSAPARTESGGETQTGAAGVSTEITTPQINKIRVMCKTLNVTDDDDVHEYVAGLLAPKFPEFKDEGTLTSLRQLTKGQGTAAIDALIAATAG